MNQRPIAVVASLLAAAALSAQSQSVLDLQKDYHIGAFAVDIDIPSGELSGTSAIGSLNAAGNGVLTLVFDEVEVTPTSGSLLANQTINPEYFVRPTGEMIWDFDPANPGTDVLGLWCNPDGSVLHTSRQRNDTYAQQILAIEKGTGLSNATLTGTHYHADQSLQFLSGAPRMVNTWGTVTFDGAGNASYMKTVLVATPAGTTTQTLSGSVPYSVSGDGTLTINGAPGGVSADGQLWFVIFGDPMLGGAVQMTIGTRRGASYDHNDLTGRYSLSSNITTLGAGAGLPNTTTDYGTLAITSNSPSSGSFTTDGVTVQGTASNVTSNPFAHSGPSNLANTGMLTLIGAQRSFEVGVSADGAYFIGREPTASSNLVFGMRQCLSSFAYGTATAGTGGQSPVLGIKTFPVLGNTAFEFQVSNAIGGGIGLVAMSAGAAPGLPALGGTIWIDPLAIGYSATMLLQGAAGVAGAGFERTGLPIPVTTTLVGYTLFAQGVFFDPAGPAGFSMTNAMQVTLCN